MTAPTIDAVAPATPAPTTTTASVPSQAESKTKAADLLTFKIGMSVLAVVVFVMAVVGVIASSSALLIATGIVGTAGVLTGVYTGINLSA